MGEMGVGRRSGGTAEKHCLGQRVGDGAACGRLLSLLLGLWHTSYGCRDRVAGRDKENGRGG